MTTTENSIWGLTLVEGLHQWKPSKKNSMTFQAISGVLAIQIIIISKNLENSTELKWGTSWKFQRLNSFPL